VTAPAEPDAPSPHGDLRLLAAFSLGFLLVLVLAFAAIRLVARARSHDGAGGVRLLLERVRGNELVLRFENDGASPREFVCPSGTEAGVEFDVRVVDESGRVVPPRAANPLEPTPAVSPATLVVPPRGSASLKLDLARFVELPHPGRYRVSVERARLNFDEPRLQSNEVVVDVP
jgi:hypothetical protein